MRPHLMRSIDCLICDCFWSMTMNSVVSMTHDSPKRIDDELDVDECLDDWLTYWMIEYDEWMLNSLKLIEICWWNDDILMIWLYIY